MCTGVMLDFCVYSLNIDLRASGVWFLESAQKNNQFKKKNLKSDNFEILGSCDLNGQWD